MIAFLNSKDPDWAQTQTVPPANPTATAKPINSIELAWAPIPYTGDGGYYEVGYSTTPGGPYSIHGRTSNKSASSYTVSNLLPGRTYYFAVRTYTPAHGDQQNNLLSGWSQEVSATTLSPTITHIEITQATQDEDNSVPLIAGKPTFVRVYLDCGEGCSAMPGVTGVLRGYGPEEDLGKPPSHQAPNHSFSRRVGRAQRGDLGKTLNFTCATENGLRRGEHQVDRWNGACRDKDRSEMPDLPAGAIPQSITCRYTTTDQEVLMRRRIRMAAGGLLDIYPRASINLRYWNMLDWKLV